MLQSLDQLGAGFSVASHDLDIRGAGNLLGDEQSGHVREVGIELYQEMLEEAVVADARGRRRRGDRRSMVAADQYRRGGADPGSLCRRSQRAHGALSPPRRPSKTREDIDRFAAELIDRFGPLPEEVKHLLEIVAIKQLCRIALVEKIDAGPKGAHAHLPQQHSSPIRIGAREAHRRSIQAR